MGSNLACDRYVYKFEPVTASEVGRFNETMEDIRRHLHKGEYEDIILLFESYSGYGKIVVEIFSNVIHKLYVKNTSSKGEFYHGKIVKKNYSNSLPSVLIFDALPAEFLIASEKVTFYKGRREALEYFLQGWMLNYKADHVLYAALLNSSLALEKYDDFMDPGFSPHIGVLLLLRDHYSIADADNYIKLIRERMVDSGYGDFSESQVDEFKKINANLSKCTLN